MANIMVVDDARDVVALVKYLLERDGRHQVTPAYSGDEALKLLGVDPRSEDVELPQLIILDIMMPGVDGYTVATRLLEDDRARDIPIIILTAKGQVQELFKMTHNVKAVMEKPFDARKFRELVAELLPAAK